MKLYHNGEPEGWQVPGKQNRKAERIDVPTTPVEAAAWLNARDVPPLAEPARPIPGGDFDDEPETQLAPQAKRVMAPGFCPECGRSAAGALKLGQGADIETVIAWAESAETWQLERVAEAIRQHSVELIERTVQ